MTAERIGRSEGRKEGRKEGREEGRTEGMRELLLLQGNKRFGAPDDEARAALVRITSVEALEKLAERLLDVGNWQELLQ